MPPSVHDLPGARPGRAGAVAALLLALTVAASGCDDGQASGTPEKRPPTATEPATPSPTVTTTATSPAPRGTVARFGKSQVQVKSIESVGYIGPDELEDFSDNGSFVVVEIELTYRGGLPVTFDPAAARLVIGGKAYRHVADYKAPYGDAFESAPRILNTDDTAQGRLIYDVPVAGVKKAVLRIKVDGATAFLAVR